MLSDKAFEYRRRARIAINVKEGKVQIGFRGKASKSIVSINQCMVLTAPLQSLFTSLKTELLKDKLAHHIGHLELLEDDKGVSLTIRLINAISPKPKGIGHDGRYNTMSIYIGKILILTLLW